MILESGSHVILDINNSICKASFFHECVALTPSDFEAKLTNKLNSKGSIFEQGSLSGILAKGVACKILQPKSDCQKDKLMN